MWRSWFIDHPLTSVALASMAIFLGAFIVVVARALRADRSTLDERARLPLLDGESHV
jgi:hypothetical protein